MACLRELGGIRIFMPYIGIYYYRSGILEQRKYHLSDRCQTSDMTYGKRAALNSYIWRHLYKIFYLMQLKLQR